MRLAGTVFGFRGHFWHSAPMEQPETFLWVIEFIEGKMMPIVVRHAVSGIANINSEDLLFEDPVALAMLIDVFSERGFHVTTDATRVG